MARRKQAPAALQPSIDWATIDCTPLVTHVHDHVARHQRPTATDLATVQTYNAAQLMKAHNQLQNELTQHGVNGDWLDCIAYAMFLACGIEEKTAEYNCPVGRWMAKAA